MLEDMTQMHHHRFYESAFLSTCLTRTSKAYISPGVFGRVGADNAIDFCIGKA